MSLTWFLQTVSLALMLNVNTFCGAGVPPCRDNWFGSPCRYKCHCINNKCDSFGECTKSSTCESGWFGPSCQYVDLVSTHTSLSTPAWVRDFPDTLCNPGQETVTISLTDTFYFTWLRLRVNASDSSHDFKLQFVSLNGTTEECINMYISVVSDTILDVHCKPGVLFQELTIKGEGVNSLCSVHISGGRNVALGQNTTQSSEYLGQFSWHAVDGDTNSNANDGSCTHTDDYDKTPTWTLTFDRPHHINRYVIYNRHDHQDRLYGFILRADEDNSIVFNYTDQTATDHDIYRIQSSSPETPVSSVTFVATFRGFGKIILTLCEVEMFGDSVCPAGLFGRECDNRSNCAKDGENCFVSTGGCPSGCAAGYHGEGCRNRLPVDGPGEFIPVAVIVGPVIGLVVLVTLVVIGVLMCRKRKDKIDSHGQTAPRRFQNYDETDSIHTVESYVMTTQPGKAAKPPERKEPSESLDNTDIHQHNVSHGYFNIVPALEETPSFSSDLNNSMAKLRKKSQEEINIDQTRSSAAVAAAPSSQHQNMDRLTDISGFSGYELPVQPPALTQKSQRLKYEDQVTYADATTPNPNESIDDMMPNPYDELLDI